MKKESTAALLLKLSGCTGQNSDDPTLRSFGKKQSTEQRISKKRSGSSRQEPGLNPCVISFRLPRILPCPPAFSCPGISFSVCGAFLGPRPGDVSRPVFLAWRPLFRPVDAPSPASEPAFRLREPLWGTPFPLPRKRKVPAKEA